MMVDTAFDLAIDDLRALMDAFAESDWQELHLADGETEIYLSRDGSRGNPLLGSTHGTIEAVDRASPDAIFDVRTPHVCTVANVSVIAGNSVVEGQDLAILSVLDEVVVLTSPVSGVVIETLFGEGELAEFGALLFRIVEGPR